MREFTHSLSIDAAPAVVLEAFFAHDALARWWQVRRSLCQPRVLGGYSIEWDPTEWRDDVLGRLGGVFRGTVVDYRAGREFLVADAYWLPPDGDPIGPMAFEVRCTAHGGGTVLHVRQSGWDDSVRWSRYYDLIATGLTSALAELKHYAEARNSRNVAR